jgi:homospermidine synthase
MYVYRVCDVAIESLKHFKDNNYKVLKNNYVLEQKDIIDKDGFDSIGALLKFENGDKMWCGSVCNNKDAIKLGFKISTATSIQVSGAVFSFIEYMINHPEEGLNEAETLHHDELLKTAKPYLGNFYCKMI